MMIWLPWETAESVKDATELVVVHLRRCGLWYHHRPLCGERGQSVYFYEWSDIPDIGDIYTVCGECLTLAQADRRNMLE